MVKEGRADKEAGSTNARAGGLRAECRMIAAKERAHEVDESDADRPTNVIQAECADSAKHSLEYGDPDGRPPLGDSVMDSTVGEPF